MKLTFDQALFKFIVKSQKILLIACAGSVSIIALLSYVTFGQLVTTEQQIRETGTKLAKLKSSYAVSTNLIKELESKTNLLSTFMPNDFDLLVMLSTVEEIGKRTNFKIQSVSLVSEPLLPGKIKGKSISITGSGSFQSFLDFLKNYKSISGQIISMDSVSLSGKDKVISNLGITMYAYNPVVDSKSFPDMSNLDKKDRDVLKVVTEYVRLGNSGVVDDKYSSKKNPFEN